MMIVTFGEHSKGQTFLNQFHQLRASFPEWLLAQATYLQRARQQRAQMVAQETSAARLPIVDSDAPAERLPARAAKKLKKAQSALEVFRKEWLARRRTLGDSTKWTATMWTDIKADFNKLSEPEKAHFHEQATLTKTVAEKNRREMLHMAGAAAAPSVPQEPPPSPAVLQPPSLGVASASDWLSVSDTREPIIDGPPDRSVAKVAGWSHAAQARTVPLSAQMFQGYVQSLPKASRATAGGIRGDVKRLEATLARRGQPWCAAARFPDKVFYDTECGALCREMPDDAKSLRQRLLIALSQVAQQANAQVNMASLARALVSFSVSSPEDDGSAVQFFGYLASAQGRSGRFTPKQNWLLCEVVREDEEGLEVRFHREEFVAHVGRDLRHPLREQAHGRLCSYDEDTMAVFLMGADLGKVSVDAQRLRYKTLSADSFLVLGADDQYSAISIPPAEEDVVDAEDLGPAPVGPEAASDGDSSRHDDGDMMDVFDMGRRSASAANAASGSGCPGADVDEDCGESADEFDIGGELARLLGVDPADADQGLQEISELLREAERDDDDDDPRPGSPVGELSGSDAGPYDSDGSVGDVREEIIVKETPDEFAGRLGLLRRPNWVYADGGSGKALGHLRCLPNGRYLKAKCMLHGTCTRFLPIEEAWSLKCAHLIAWLAAGKDFDTSGSHQAHQPNMASLLRPAD